MRTIKLVDQSKRVIGTAQIRDGLVVKFLSFMDFDEAEHVIVPVTYLIEHGEAEAVLDVSRLTDRQLRLLQALEA